MDPKEILDLLVDGEKFYGKIVNFVLARFPHKPPKFDFYVL